MKKHYDVVVIGSGIAGLYSALHLSPELSVLVLSKHEFMTSNSSLAQGGIAAVLDREHDSTDIHFSDTMIAGGFKNNTEAVRVLVGQGPEEVENLLRYGVHFDRAPDGGIHFTLEGGHSVPRILHHKDSTGYEVSRKLIDEVEHRKNIEIMQNCIVCRISRGKCYHLLLSMDGQFSGISAGVCMIATGGIGRAFEYTTNSKGATGDGICLAFQMGAEIRSLHSIQFHPTGFANRQTRETFLISEAVRGEGAYLLNCQGRRFLHEYDERGELAPRDVVSRAMIEEEKKTGSNSFFLDITHKDPAQIRSRFPLIDENVRKLGIDMTKDLIPVYPCQHYLMGGIQVDTEGRTSLPGLYAVGECAHTGAHGANRLASNSLLEALVFSRRAAEDINQNAAKLKGLAEETPGFEVPESSVPIPSGIRTEVREIMQKACFVVPDRAEAAKGFLRINELKNELEQGTYRLDADYVEALSLVTIAYIVLQEIM